MGNHGRQGWIGLEAGGNPRPRRWIILSIILVLASGTWGLVSCIGDPLLYFSGDVPPPRLASVYVDTTSESGDDPSLQSDVGSLAGGQVVTLRGENLNAAGLTVRIGDHLAALVPQSLDPAGQLVSVIVPPGPLQGGPVTVTVAHEGGIAQLAEAFEYRVPSSALFDREAGSVQLVGTNAGTASGIMGFWPLNAPRQAGSLLNQGDLFYLPADINQALEWPVTSHPPPWAGPGDLGVANQVAFTQPARPELAPFIFERSPISGRFDLCPGIDGVAPTWIPGAQYQVSVSGGALEVPKSKLLDAPPAFASAEEVPAGLEVVAGVAQVNLDLPLEIQFPPSPLQDDRFSAMLLELVIYVPEASSIEAPYELHRLVVRGDETEGLVTLPMPQFPDLPEVNTDCALAARNLSSARATSSDTVAALELAYLDLGCEGMDDPMAAYPEMAYLRLTRHITYALSLGEGTAGCSSPGTCPGEAELAIDLVHKYEIPVSLGHFPLSLCTDGLDNDGDGLSDLEDPGCADEADDTELDETGAFLCDDGVDNDGDGVLDYRADSAEGDPGCESAFDESEVGQGICDDGVDNDKDGLADFRVTEGMGDPGCESARDTDELSEALPCDNGKDDDGDGLYDFQTPVGAGDPGCESPTDMYEKDSTGDYPCDDGVDNDRDGAADQEDAGCRTIPTNSETYTPYEPDEYNPYVECDDGTDNDGDGGIDVGGGTDGIARDYECDSASDTSETY